ncbi:MAG TPA: family 16 glycosylhydrolase [Tepidisphaeraceae bacterium]|nr:family 16 glycosylhydrolase [Tepidisphaeraceae bacterium]
MSESDCHRGGVSRLSGWLAVGAVLALPVGGWASLPGHGVDGGNDVGTSGPRGDGSWDFDLPIAPPLPPDPDVPIGPGGLIWSDEFDGTSLDMSKWTWYRPGVRWDALNVPEAISVGDGKMRITVYSEPNGSGGLQHYSSMITTAGIFEPTYGYFESRMRFNTSPGQWSAFWVQTRTNGRPVGSPSTAGVEMDIIEHRYHNAGSNDISNSVQHALHWDGYGQNHKTTSRTTRPAGMGNGSWHTFGMLWTPNGLTFYINGVQTWFTDVAVSDIGQYIILSAEVMNQGWAGRSPLGGYGSRETSDTWVEFDYVRVYGLGTQALVGDINRDGVVNNLDIAPFVALLTNPGRMAPDLTYLADINGDGSVNNLDIAPFVTLLTQGRPEGFHDLGPFGTVWVPEPASLSLVALALPMRQTIAPGIAICDAWGSWFLQAVRSNDATSISGRGCRAGGCCGIGCR